MKKQVFLLTLVCMLSACGHARDEQGYRSIDCSGWFDNWGDCVAEADRICADNGGYVARWDQNAKDRIMRVRCGGE